MKTLVLLAAFAVAPVLHAQTQWKLATGYRAESFHTRNLVQFAQDVERASAGALRIEVHANNALFKLNEIPQAVQEGKAQAGETIMTNLVRTFQAWVLGVSPASGGAARARHRARSTSSRRPRSSERTEAAPCVQSRSLRAASCPATRRG